MVLQVHPAQAGEERFDTPPPAVGGRPRTAHHQAGAAPAPSRLRGPPPRVRPARRGHPRPADHRQCRAPVGARRSPRRRGPPAGPRSRPVAWVSLDSTDNQPRAFWSYVVGALRASGAVAPDNPLAHLVPGLGSEDEILRRFVAGVSELPEPVVLVLDDFHLIDDPTVIAAVTALVRVPVPQLRLVLLTRADPMLPLHRLRLAGRARGDPLGRPRPHPGRRGHPPGPRRGGARARRRRAARRPHRGVAGRAPSRGPVPRPRRAGARTRRLRR